MADIDRDALELVAEDLAKGNQLTFTHVGNVFGSDFWELLVFALMDSQDAARAIQGAISRLRESGVSVDDDFEDTVED